MPVKLANEAVPGTPIGAGTLFVGDGTGGTIAGELYMKKDDDSILLLSHSVSNPLWLNPGWSFQTNASDPEYAGGFYDFASGSDDFGVAVLFGQVNGGYAAHLSLITGSVPGSQAVIRVSGTSITDAGVRTASDFEDITIPASTAVNSYFETPKKWLGQVSIESISGPLVDCNYGYTKYYDAGNQNFTLLGLEALWSSDSPSGTSNIELLHHKSTGWTYSGAGEPSTPTPVAARNTDYVTEVDDFVGQGAWKRTDLSQAINGAGSEGILFRVTSASSGIGSLSFRILNIGVSLCIDC